MRRDADGVGLGPADQTAGTGVALQAPESWQQAAYLATEAIAQSTAVSMRRVDPSLMHVTLRADVVDFSFIPQTLISAGYRLTLMREEDVNLETAFMRLTKGIVQ